MRAGVRREERLASAPRCVVANDTKMTLVRPSDVPCEHLAGRPRLADEACPVTTLAIALAALAFGLVPRAEVARRPRFPLGEVGDEDALAAVPFGVSVDDGEEDDAPALA